MVSYQDGLPVCLQRLTHPSINRAQHTSRDQQVTAKSNHQLNWPLRVWN